MSQFYKRPTRKPLRRSPIARGLSHLWGIQSIDGSGVLRDMVGLANGAFSGNNSWALIPGGYAVKFEGPAGTGSDIPVGDSSGSGAPLSASNFTFVFKFRLTTVAAGQQTLYGSDNADALAVRIEADKLTLMKTFVAQASDTTALVTNRDYSGAISYDGTTVRFYIDGIARGTVSSGTYASSTVAFQYKLGQEIAVPDWGGGSNPGYLYYFGIYDRVVTPAEIWQLHVNPQQLLSPTGKISSFQSAFGGGQSAFGGGGGVTYNNFRRRRRI